MKLFGWIGILAFCATTSAGRADSPVRDGFTGDRYTTLWTKSPFAIATPDAGATSADYSLVGTAQFDGVTYVSLIDKQTQEHFVLATGKPVRNLTLVSVAHGSDSTSATIQRNGETLVLRQEQAPAVAPVAPPDAADIRPVAVEPPLSVGGSVPPAYIAPPRVRLHRPIIRTPPRPGFPVPPPPQPRPQAEQPPGAQPAQPQQPQTEPAH